MKKDYKYARRNCDTPIVSGYLSARTSKASGANLMFDTTTYAAVVKPGFALAKNVCTCPVATIFWIFVYFEVSLEPVN